MARGILWENHASPEAGTAEALGGFSTNFNHFFLSTALKSSNSWRSGVFFPRGRWSGGNFLTRQIITWCVEEHPFFTKIFSTKSPHFSRQKNQLLFLSLVGIFFRWDHGEGRLMTSQTDTQRGRNKAGPNLTLCSFVSSD